MPWSYCTRCGAWSVSAAAKPYLKLNAKHCPNALNILDRFHIVAKMNLALDDVRAAEARRMANEQVRGALPLSRLSEFPPPPLCAASSAP
ncbi:MULTISPECIES: transposase [unclassified Cupriavidus]|uniref:transposase n=1 Tax=Cupriavidus sp. AcVe19-6a TaxID=2821358 RepID=UPI001AEAE6F4|nr:transposase [Cupriavidus sp. AcVe19-1a]MBP0640227.1 transposase [Cupriavidus sp. AcVe19-6a]